MTRTVEATLARHRVVTAVMLAVLTLLAWVWLAMGAGMGAAPGLSLPGLMPAADPMPAMSGMEMPSVDPAASWSGPHFLLSFAMWWVMMVAMMVPSAAPMILLHVRAATGVGAPPATGYFLGGYLLVWGLFSLAAAGLQTLLHQAGLMAGMDMVSASRPLSAALLIGAGLYQLSPVKDMCLSQCRSPARFLSRHYEPGNLGTLRMGVIHGAYCAGCCWMLMALLFVGGLMNLVWIALLTLIVAAEKLLPGGDRIAAGLGVLCLVWGGLVVIG